MNPSGGVFLSDVVLAEFWFQLFQRANAVTALGACLAAGPPGLRGVVEDDAERAAVTGAHVTA
jgi:hypothetical protein